jgi:hypothetical protein
VLDKKNKVKMFSRVQIREREQIASPDFLSGFIHEFFVQLLQFWPVGFFAGKRRRKSRQKTA